MPGLSVPTEWILSKAKFQRNYLWDVLLPDISATFAGIPTGGLIGFGLSQLVESVQFGDYSIETPHKMRFGPNEANFAGLFTVDKVKMTFRKTIPDAVSAYFDAWKNLIVDSKGLYQVKGNYQKTMYVRFLASDGIAIGRYKLTGCFPTRFPSYSLDYSTEKITTVDVEFTVDKVSYEWF